MASASALPRMALRHLGQSADLTAAGAALLKARPLAQSADVTQAVCPAGVPVQTLTVVNQEVDQ
jgi:hypothetical protein